MIGWWAAPALFQADFSVPPLHPKIPIPAAGFRQQIPSGNLEISGAHVWGPAHQRIPRSSRAHLPHCHFSKSSRALMSFSSCSFCCAIRSEILSSSRAPDDPAACSTSCRMLPSRIAMRSLSSGSERVLSLLMGAPWRAGGWRNAIATKVRRPICILGLIPMAAVLARQSNYRTKWSRKGDCVPSTQKFRARSLVWSALRDSRGERRRASNAPHRSSSSREGRDAMPPLPALHRAQALATPTFGNWAVLPRDEAYCAATPTERSPFIGNAVSSMTSTASLPPMSRSA
jgi:hypothetical protein